VDEHDLLCGLRWLCGIWPERTLNVSLAICNLAAVVDCVGEVRVRKASTLARMYFCTALLNRALISKKVKVECTLSANVNLEDLSRSREPEKVVCTFGTRW
jgi:hypothetical protein